MSLIEITYDDREVLAVLKELQARAADLEPALLEIGEDLVPRWKRRFDTSTGPDGRRWLPNTQTSIIRYLEGQSGSFGKRGKITKKGAARAMAKRPLVQEGYLRDTLEYQLDGDTLLIGSPQKYAAVQQFGAERGSLGKGAPWGDIPARPFLGVSDEDRATILQTLTDYLTP